MPLCPQGRSGFRVQGFWSRESGWACEIPVGLGAQTFHLLVLEGPAASRDAESEHAAEGRKGCLHLTREAAGGSSRIWGLGPGPEMFLCSWVQGERCEPHV